MIVFGTARGTIARSLYSEKTNSVVDMVETIQLHDPRMHFDLPKHDAGMVLDSIVSAHILDKPVRQTSWAR